MKMKKLLLNSTFLLCFFPFIRVIPFITAEAQPIAVIPALLYLVIFKRSRFLHSYSLPYLLGIVLYLAISITQIFLNPFNNISASAILESFIIFMIPLLIFLALLDNLTVISVKLFKNCIYLWFALSTIQYFFPSLLIYLGVDRVLGTLISRFSSSAIGGTRGVVGFSSEPSHAAQIIFSMFLYCTFFYNNNKLKSWDYYLLISMCIFMCLFNRSTSVVLFLVVYFFLYFTFKTVFILKNKIHIFHKFKVKKKTFFIATFILLGISIIVPQLLTKSRLADVMSLLYYTEISPFNLFSLLKFTIALGDLRLISVYAGYFNLILTHGFGSGLGSWSTGFLDTLQESGINPFSIPYFLVYGFVNMKPHAYGGLVAFDMGLIGLILLTYMFFLLIVKHLKKYQTLPYSIACLGSAIFMIYLNSLTSLPTGWLIFLIFLHDTNLPKLYLRGGT